MAKGRQKAGCHSRSIIVKNGRTAGRRELRYPDPAAARAEPGRSQVARRKGKVGILWSERSGQGAMISLG